MTHLEMENFERLEKTRKEIKYKKSISNIPTRYKNAQLKAINQNQQEIINKLINNYSNKKFHEMRDILITGNIGVGKTYLVCGILNAFLNWNIYCKYTTEYELLNLYFMKEYSKFNNFKNTDILVIDELGKRELQDWQIIQIEELLSHRYNELMPTILITNKNKEEFKKFIGSRIVDRLKDNKLMLLSLVGESLRDNK